MAQHAVRRKYEAYIKLKVEAFAKLSSNCAAAWNLMLQKTGGKIGVRLRINVSIKEVPANG